MLELAARVIAIAHSLLLVIHVSGILHLGPHKVLREQLLLASLRVNAVKLKRVRYLAKVPSGSVSQLAATALSTLAASLHLLTTSLALTGQRRCVSVKPYTHRSSRTVRVSNHRRVELTALQHKHLVADARLPRSLLLTDAEHQILLIRNFFTINAWILEIFHYLCHGIQIQIVHVSENRSLLVYKGLDFFFIQIE